MASHLSVHSTTFPLMPAPRTLLPTKNSSSKGVVLTTRGGCGLGKFGPLLPISEEEIRIQPSHRTLVCCTGGLWQMGIPGSRTQHSAGGFLWPVQPGSSKSLALLYTVYSTTHLRMADQATIWDYHTSQPPYILPQCLISYS